MSAVNEVNSMEKADILVTVPLLKYTALDYDKADAIIKAGYDAAASKASVLTAFSVSEAEWEDYIAARNARRKTTPVPQFIAVTGTSPELAKAMEKQMSPLVGKPVDTEQVGQDMMTIVGMGRFSTATYSMTEKNGQQGLQVQAEQKSYAPPIVRPLIIIDGSEYNNVLFSLGARITFMDVGSYRSELRNDVVLGSQYLLSSEYYHPYTTTSNWFIAPRAGFNSTQFNVYSSNTLQASYRIRQYGGGLDTGYVFGRTGEFRLGYEGGWEVPLLQLRCSDTPDKRDRGIFGISLPADYTLDDPVIPRAACRLLIYTKGYTFSFSSPFHYPRHKLSNFSILSTSSIFVSASGGSSYGYKTGLPAFSLGGSRHLVAWGTNELLTNQYFLGQIGYIRELVKLPPFLGSSVNALGILEVSKTSLASRRSPVRQIIRGMWLANLACNTIFVPVLIRQDSR